MRNCNGTFGCIFHLVLEAPAAICTELNFTYVLATTVTSHTERCPSNKSMKTDCCADIFIYWLSVLCVLQRKDPWAVENSLAS